MEKYFCNAIQLSVEFEHRSEDFYRSAIAQVKDEFGKKALQFLADDEIKHVEKIKAFNTALLSRDNFDLEAQCCSDLPERLSDFLDEVAANKSKDINEESSDIDVYDAALSMEKTGHEAYLKAFEDEKDPRVKKFFKFLADQETLHYKLLEESKRYLEDSSYYFEDYGGWIFST